MQLESLPKGYVTPEGLKQLKQYKYKSGKYTWLDNQINPFWQWCVSLVPTWVAPNLITFIGWLFVIASYLNILIYDYTFKHDIPRYCFFFAALCSFVYSTLDSIDGKQARRTKSSSPLGQLFDHGCDSFSITFFILGICQAAKLDMDEVFIIFTASLAIFWTSNWLQYQTGVLQTNMGQFGVTQAQYIATLFHIITGIFGQNFWQITISSFIPFKLSQQYNWLIDIRIGTILAYAYGISFFLMIIYIMITTAIQTKKYKSPAQFFTLAIMLVICYIWFNLQIYQAYTGLILINFGIVQSLVVCKVIICSVTKMPLQYFHSQIIPSIIGTILMIGLQLQQNLNGQITVFWILITINLVMIFKFLYSTIGQLTKFLGIYCFSLKKRNQDQKLL